MVRTPISRIAGRMSGGRGGGSGDRNLRGIPAQKSFEPVSDRDINPLLISGNNREDMRRQSIETREQRKMNLNAGLSGKQKKPARVYADQPCSRGDSRTIRGHLVTEHKADRCCSHPASSRAPRPYAMENSYLRLLPRCQPGNRSSIYPQPLWW